MSACVRILAAVVCAVLMSGAVALGQGFSSSVSLPYRIVPNITYLTANNFEAKLDVYSRTDSTAPQPTLIWIHGGGWTGGNKETAMFNLLPYMEMGWNVVNVEYRLARVSLAPAAVEDCLCALRWVIRNAKQYGFDTARLVVSGSSAGGHLALTTAVTPASEGLDRQCPGTEELKVAGVDGELVTITGGKHGGFTREENQRAYTAIKAFLAKHGLRAASSSN